MRTLIAALAITFGLSLVTAMDASACGWSSKTASDTSTSQTVMAPQTPAPKPSSDG